MRLTVQTRYQSQVARVVGYYNLCKTRRKTFVIPEPCLEPGAFESTAITPKTFSSISCNHRVHSCSLRICSKPAVIRHASSARTSTISQLLLQFGIFLLQPLYLTFVEYPKILFSVPSLVETLHFRQCANLPGVIYRGKATLT